MATVGEQLRAAREQRKLSIEQMAEETKIRGDHLRALESGDFSAFSARVYVKGFTRTYATRLKLDTPELLKQLEREMTMNHAFDESLDRTPNQPSEPLWALVSRINWPVALAIAIVLVVGSIGYTLVRNYRAEQARDPLSELGTGLYQPKSNDPAEYLPLPTNTPAPQPRRRL